MTAVVFDPLQPYRTNIIVSKQLDEYQIVFKWRFKNIFIDQEIDSMWVVPLCMPTTLWYIYIYIQYRLIPDLNFRRWRRLFENYHQMIDISLLCIKYGYFFTVQYKRNARILLCYYDFNIIIYSNATAAIFLLILTSSEPLCRVSTTCRKQMYICDVNRSYH